MNAADAQTTGSRRHTRRTALLLLVRAFPGRLAVLASLILLAGALPAVFAALVARLVEALPTAVTGGFDSADGRRIIGTLIAIGGVLLVREVVTAASGVAETDLYHRYDENLLARVMRTTLAAPRLELFEDPQLAAKTDRAVRIPGFGPGEVVTGLAMKGAVQAQGLAAAVLVATVWPLAAAVLAVVWIVVGRQLQANYEASFTGTDPSSWSEPLRRSRYLKQLALMPAWAKELRVFGLVEWLGDRFGQQSALVLEELWRARRTGQRGTGVLLTVVVVANAFALALATRSALDGTLAIGPLTVLVQGLFGMASLASQEGDGFIANGSIAVPDVLELERTVAARVPVGSGTVPGSGHPVREICFEQVRFAYPGRDTAVFDQLDLRLEAGQSLGIVGLNGAGKTTLIKLLAGLEVPQEGRITVDGVDLADLDLISWQRAVAAIFQDFVHYELPARDNIGLGAVEHLRAADVDERLIVAARRVSADTVLADLPKGLDTVLSRRFPGGVDLSGGQWQRIALARAIAAVGAGARVLVLDEPTAHLDVRAEADLYDRFLDLTKGLTTIVISHRFSTIRRADRIVVLEAGRITEDGSHDDLVAAGGQYARLFRKQAMRYAGLTVEPGDDSA